MRVSDSRIAALRPNGHGQWVWRALVIGLAAMVAWLVLWIAGYEPLQWWRVHEAAAAARAAEHPKASPVGPIVVVQPTPTGTDSSVSAAPLALHLTATRLGRNSLEGYADIGVDRNSPQTYRAGSLLANGTRLSEIYKDHVVLKRGDRSARLYLEGQAQPDGALLTKAGSLLSVGGITATAVAPANSYDPLTEVMRVTPVYEGDTFEGIQIYPATASAGFRSLGLEPGDRIVSIEGAAMRDPAAAINALRDALSGQAIAVVVRRGKETLSLSIDGSALRGSSGPP